MENGQKQAKIAKSSSHAAAAFATQFPHTLVRCLQTGDNNGHCDNRQVERGTRETAGDGTGEERTCRQ